MAGRIAVTQPFGSAMQEAGHRISDIETLRGGLDARDDAPINMPRLRAIARLSEAADHCRTCLSATHPYIVGDAHFGDHERSIRSIMNTESGDHEHTLAII
jgi:hypothetical protein